MVKTVTIPAAVLIFMAVHGAPAHAEIFQKTNSDGTVEYYNSSGTRGGPASRLPKTRFDGIIDRISRDRGLDPYLVKCIIKAESDFNPDAVSESGAMGLMQLMMPTAKYYNVRDPLDPAENLRAGIGHFSSLMAYFGNDIPLALAAYHAGLGIVKKGMAVPPIDATVRYVNKVMAMYRGDGDYRSRVKTIYRRIDSDGTINIYSK